jgi:hypothetical protein
MQNMLGTFCIYTQLGNLTYLLLVDLLFGALSPSVLCYNMIYLGGGKREQF